MAFEKGKIKTGGRKKGSSNKDIKALREKVIEILNKSVQTILKDLESLEPNQRLNHFSKLINFVSPKVTEQNVYNDNSQKLMTWNIIPVSPDDKKIENNSASINIELKPIENDNETMTEGHEDNNLNETEDEIIGN